MFPRYHMDSDVTTDPNLQTHTKIYKTLCYLLLFIYFCYSFFVVTNESMSLLCEATTHRSVESA